MSDIGDDDMLTEPNQAMIDGMSEVMAQKAVELFRLCDREGKGYITKRDICRLDKELPEVSKDQLEVVFDSLDSDGNGSLTLDEFTEGFGSFLGIRPRHSPRDQSADNQTQWQISRPPEEEAVYQDDDVSSYDGYKQFEEMIMRVDAAKTFQDENVIKAMWKKLHHEEPEVAAKFEDFLAHISDDVAKSKYDFQTLEQALLSKNNEHAKEVKRLYEEMEAQIKAEQEKVIAKEKQLEKQMKQDLEQQMQDKDKMLQDMMARHAEMEKKLQELNQMEHLTKRENDRLQKEKDMLADELDKSKGDLEESKHYIHILHQTQMEEKKEKARAALNLSEGIAIERESLVKQLDILKDVNKRLRDDRDEAKAFDARLQIADAHVFSHSFTSSDEAEPSEVKAKPIRAKRRELKKQGSVLSKYFPGGGGVEAHNPQTAGSFNMDISHTLEWDDSVIDHIQNQGGEKRAALHAQHNVHSGDTTEESDTQDTQDTQDTPDTADSGGKKKRKKFKFPSQKRKQPVGASSDVQQERGDVPSNPSNKPQRIFKVVFVGDSGVGKSSFIHRFCHEEFKPAFAATIGVDFQIKTMDFRNTTCILQLWDTAGQERYRSLTNAYFRKADGVIIMYDVTCEKSFMNVRNWMESVQNLVEPGTVIALLGNKVDDAAGCPERQVKEKDGGTLAKEYDSIFYETSAKSGYRIQDAMEEMTSLLQEKEDMKMEEGVKLLKDLNKRGCCSR